jgi:PAS domain S-box-containing protein
METSGSPFYVTIPFIVSLLIMLVLAYLALEQRRQTTARIFFIFTLLVSIWLAGFILEILSPTLSAKRFWSDLQYLGISFIPVAWVLMLSSYLGFRMSIIKLGASLIILPVTTLILMLTNRFHHLFRIEPWLDTQTAAFPILVNDYGPWFYWVHAPYMYLLFLTSAFLLIRSILFKNELYRRQIIVLLIALLLPLATDIAYVAGHSLIPNFNLTGVVFSISGILLAYSLLQHKFLDIMPAARSKLIESMRDGWLVLDQKGRIQDMNAMAKRLLKTAGKPLIGQTVIPTMLPSKNLIPLITATEDQPAEIEIQLDGKSAFYDVTMNILKEKQETIHGRLIIFRDISRRKLAERERERLLKELQDSIAHAKTLQGLLPICANCKNIRDDAGYWHKVETYVASHSDATFTHGICPNCMKELYGEINPETEDE